MLFLQLYKMNESIFARTRITPRDFSWTNFNDFAAKAQYEILRQSTKNSKLGPPPPVTMLRDHYLRELKHLRDSRKPYNYDSFYNF